MIIWSLIVPLDPRQISHKVERPNNNGQLKPRPQQQQQTLQPPLNDPRQISHKVERPNNNGQLKPPQQQQQQTLEPPLNPLKQSETA